MPETSIYLFIGYFLLWVIVFATVLFIGMKIFRLEREISVLKAQLHEESKKGA